MLTDTLESVTLVELTEIPNSLWQEVHAELRSVDRGIATALLEFQRGNLAPAIGVIHSRVKKARKDADGYMPSQYELRNRITFDEVMKANGWPVAHRQLNVIRLMQMRRDLKKILRS